MADRYDTSSTVEGSYEPGSKDQVLRNKLGVIDPDEMEGLEFDALVQFQQNLFDELAVDASLTAQSLCEWHRDWLGGIYDWAGQYRSVNMSKDGFTFAAAHLIHKLMHDFEVNQLSAYTPSRGMSQQALAEAMAICHVEFIVIHPFREGNGRLGRLLVTVMALQADMPPLDFIILESEKERYIKAIHAGHAGDYEPMTIIFSEVLNYSLEQASRNERDE